MTKTQKQTLIAYLRMSCAVTDINKIDTNKLCENDKSIIERPSQKYKPKGERLTGSPRTLAGVHQPSQ